MRAAHLSLMLMLGVPGLLLALEEARRSGEGGTTPPAGASGFPDRLLLAVRQERPAVRHDLPAGLTQKQVLDHLGPPSHVSREVIASRGVEQWHFGPPRHLRLVFDCPRGEAPRLVSHHITRAP